MKQNRTFLKCILTALSAVVVLSTYPAYSMDRDDGNATDTINPYSPRKDHHYRYGVIGTRETHEKMRMWSSANHPIHPGVSTGKLKGAEAAAAALAAATASNTLSFNGGINGVGVTSGTPRVYLVFWGSQWGTVGTDSTGNVTLSGDPKGAAPYLQKLFKGLGTNNELWSGTMTQYCDGPLVTLGSTSCPAGAPRVGYPTGGALAGVWVDTSSAAPAAATAAQIASEAVNAAGHFGNTTSASNRYVQYIIVSPTGTKPDGFNTPTGGFCAWHDFTGDTGLATAGLTAYGNIAFTNMPYVTDAGASCGQSFVSTALDGFSIVAGHEYAETVTDQFPGGGWINNTGSTSNGMENGDECSWISSGQGASAMVNFSTGSFAMQSTWSNDTNRCDLSHPIVASAGGGTPTASFGFTANKLVVSFTDASTDAGGVIGSYAWTFGDGGTASVANPSHTYSAAGTYTVTETVKDSANGAMSSKSTTVTVSAGGGTPVANFTSSASGLTVAFTDQSTDTGGTIGSYSWNFGDGSTSAVSSPSHTYASAGTYTISEVVKDSVSGLSSTKTSVITLTSGSQLIVNPGFEAASATPWVLTLGVQCTNSTCPGQVSHSGVGFAWLDGYGSTHTDSASQALSIPSGKKTATLSFYIHINTKERGKVVHDTLAVQVLNSSGVLQSTLATYSNVNAAPGYVHKTLDMSAFIGKSVILKFVGTEDASLATSFVLDDITLTVQ
jgi:PKD repeat protein